MFVQQNTVKAIKTYFQQQLGDLFSSNELKVMIKESVMIRLNLTSAEYLLSDDNHLSESDLLYFRSIVKRLLSNEPFQYILGTTYFYGLPFKTDWRALIPRPETEELVKWVSESYEVSQSLAIADVCTGSGCIALSIKSLFENAKMLALDIAEDAIGLALENAASLQLDIEIAQINALDASAYEFMNLNSFDCWITNPPYITIQEKEYMGSNVLHYEPHLALFVEDNDPLIFYREIGNNALKYLKPGGLFFCELNENYTQETAELMKSIGFVNIEVRKDLQGKKRMIKAQKP